MRDLRGKKFVSGAASCQNIALQLWGDGGLVRSSHWRAARQWHPAKEPETADSLKIKYLTDNEAAKAAIDKLWNFDPTALSATVQQGAPGIIEVTAKFAPDKPELFGFLLLANLGHVVAL